MEMVHAIILGIVEGVTEFLPVSSTGHLVLFAEWLRIPTTDFLKSFEIAIQLGAIVAVVGLYSKKLLTDFDIWKKIIVAFVPTAVIGLLFYSAIRSLLGSPVVVAWAIGIGGVVMILAEWYLNKKLSLHPFQPDDTEQSQQISYTQAIGVGLFQCIAFIPGVSRSAATIIGGLLLGMTRRMAVEFSFLLAIPVMVAATGLDLLKTSIAFTSSEWVMLVVGAVVAGLTAWAAIAWLLCYVERWTFVPFGVYRILLFGVLVLFIL